MEWAVSMSIIITAKHWESTITIHQVECFGVADGGTFFVAAPKDLGPDRFELPIVDIIKLELVHN